MRIGIYGGTFNPIHEGHMHVARHMLESANLDMIYLIPSYQSPNKIGSNFVAPEHRFNMCEIASYYDNTIVVSDIEINRTNTSYTYLTIQEFYQKHPSDQLYFIMGADSIDYFDKWKNPDIICQLCHILVFMREGYDIKQIEEKISTLTTQYNARITRINAPNYNVSSSQIRSDLKAEYNVCPFGLNPNVYSYIKEHQLYTE